MFNINSIKERMLKTINRDNVSAIGLELALEKIHLVQMEKTSSGDIQYRAKTSIPFSGSRDKLLESPKEMKALVKKALSTSPFKGKKVITVMPATYINIISSAYYLNKGQKEEDAILELMKQRVHGNLSDYVIDHLPIRGKKEDEEYFTVIAYARYEHVVAYLESLRKAGLNVIEMEVGPSAIKRLIGAIPTANVEDNVLVINFGGTKSFMTLISGRRLLFDQEIKFGEELLLEKIANLLNITTDMSLEIILKHGLNFDAQQTSDDKKTGPDIARSLNEILKPMFMKLVNEINKALIYAASETRGESVRHVYLLGSIARWPGSERLLNLLINIPVSIPNPTELFEDKGNKAKYPAQDAYLSTEVAIASGLALRALEGK